MGSAVAVTFVLGLSILLQVGAAVLALRLIKRTGHWKAWSLIALAIILMALRRSVTFGRLLAGDESLPPDLVAESIALVISSLMIGGLAFLDPLFRSLQDGERALRELERRTARHADELEALVEARTRSLEEVTRRQSEMEKLAATGRMAAGVAHEISNPLTGIKNAFHLLRQAVPDKHPHRQFVDLADKEIRRIGDIVSLMFQLYRTEPGETAEIDLRELIRETCLILDRKIARHHLRLETNVPEELPPLRLPANELRQILYNLIANAVEASPPEGRLTIETAVEHGAVVLRVIDDGPGVPPEIRPHIFEPFFSTKRREENGGGMGLGLAVSHSLTIAMGGAIDVDAAPGRGAVFQLTLPWAETDQARSEA